MRKHPSRSRPDVNISVGEDLVLSSIAMAIAEPARTRMLLSLMDGHARTSTELAAIAEVRPSTASAHLNRLAQNRLVRAASEGRHRYYSLYSAEVATVLEGLSIVAGTSVKAFVPSTPTPLRRARTCYDHLAGTVAVALHDHFLHEGWLKPDSEPAQGTYKLCKTGENRLEQMGIDVQNVQLLRRRFAYSCMDWSERKPHIAGALGASLLKMATSRRWVVRELDSRALSLTDFGEREIWKEFGIKI